MKESWESFGVCVSKKEQSHVQSNPNMKLILICEDTWMRLEADGVSFTVKQRSSFLTHHF